MAINRFNSKAGYSISDPPVNLIDSSGNYTTTTGNINAVDGIYTGNVSAYSILFPDSTTQTTAAKLPDYLLFNLGII
jgi:hypothetical protein